MLILLFRYPDGLAWQLNLERKVIRNCEALEKLKAFLVSETESVSNYAAVTIYCIGHVCRVCQQ